MTKTAQYLPAPDEEIVYSIPEGDDETLTAADKAAEAAVEQLSSNAEKGTIIRIYRQLGSGRESMEFVAKYPADKYSIDDLIEKMQIEYGGGDYRFMVYNDKGKIAANKLISIAKKQEKASEENSGLYGLLSAMMDKQDNFARVMLSKQNDSNSNRMEMLQEMVIMKNLFSSGESSGSSAVAQLKELMEAMELLKTMGENDDNDSGFANIFKESIPLLQTIAEAANKPVQSPGTYKPSNQDKNMGIQNLVKFALLQCEHGKTSEEVMDMIIQQLTSTQLDQLGPFIKTDNIIDRLVLMNADVGRHKEWFIDLIEWLKGYLGYDSVYRDEFNEDLDLTKEGEGNTINLDEFAKSNTAGDTVRESGDASDT